MSKITKEEYLKLKDTSKNQRELLYKVFINETDNRIPYPQFLTKLHQWITLIQREPNFERGVQKINKYLDSKFA